MHSIIVARDGYHFCNERYFARERSVIQVTSKNFVIVMDTIGQGIRNKLYLLENQMEMFHPPLLLQFIVCESYIMDSYLPIKILFVI